MYFSEERLCPDNRREETLILSQLLLTASLQRLLQLLYSQFTIDRKKISSVWSLYKNRHSKQCPGSTAANSPIHVQQPVKSTVIPFYSRLSVQGGRDGLQLKDKSNYSRHLVSLRLPLITVKSNYRQHHVFLTKNTLIAFPWLKKQTIQKLCNFNLLHAMTLTDCGKEKNSTEFWRMLFILVDMGRAFPLPAKFIDFLLSPQFSRDQTLLSSPLLSSLTQLCTRASKLSLGHLTVGFSLQINSMGVVLHYGKGQKRE